MVETIEYRGITIKIWVGTNATYWWSLFDCFSPWPFAVGDDCSCRDDALVAAKRQISRHFADWE